MGSRTMPTMCPHGVTVNWGAFGSDPDDGAVGADACAACDAAVETVDDMVATLDGRGERWDMHRGQGDGSGPMWFVRLGDQSWQSATRTFRAPTIVDVLRAAVDAGPPLPTVPRRPRPVERHLTSVRRDGSTWAFDYDGRRFLGNFPTRKAAEAAVDREVAAHAAQQAEWGEKWGATVAAGVEGVDFRWVDR